MAIKFKSDHLLWGRGFLLNYTVEFSRDIPPYPEAPQIEQGTCGNDFVLAGVNQLPIVSPNFPGKNKKKFPFNAGRGFLLIKQNLQIFGNILSYLDKKKFEINIM